MIVKKIILLTIVLASVLVQSTDAGATASPKGLLPNPIEIAKWQIETLIELIVNLVKTQFKILNDIREKVTNITDTAVNAAMEMIDLIIDGTVGKLRAILQDALDKGINVTECFVLNMDKLRILRRRLVIGEVQCATSQVGELYDIIDGATQNFTADLAVVFDLPKRLQKCMITLTPISCVTSVVEDVTDLQKAIPAQILGTMIQVSDYLDGFDQRVHRCQFVQLRKAIEGTRLIVDDMLECVRHPSGSDEHGGGELTTNVPKV